MQHLRLLLGHKIYRDLGLTYYHVSYPEELLVSGKPLKNIVGYDQDSVYTFADSKKKPLTGNTDMKSNLSPAINDVCADFAVSVSVQQVILIFYYVARERFERQKHVGS